MTYLCITYLTFVLPAQVTKLYILHYTQYMHEVFRRSPSFLTALPESSPGGESPAEGSDEGDSTHAVH